MLRDPTGSLTAISDFRGKLILLELVGMTCPACNALSGANEPGMTAFREIKPQRGLASIERYAQRYARPSLEHRDIVFVQLVLYGMDGRSPPSEDDVRAWASHYRLDRARNQVVLAGDARFISRETRRLIPGFSLGRRARSASRHEQQGPAA